jgi:hypothetical protein
MQVVGSAPKAHPPLAENPTFSSIDRRDKMKVVGSAPKAHPPSAKKMADKPAENPTFSSKPSDSGYYTDCTEFSPKSASRGFFVVHPYNA